MIVLAVITVWFNYLVVAEWRWGQTLGSSRCGSPSPTTEEERSSWNRSVARNLLLVVDVVAGLVLIPLSARKQRLGDRLAHTVVLVKDAAASARRGPAGPLPAGSLPPPAARRRAAPATARARALPRETVGDLGTGARRRRDRSAAR